MCHGVLRQGDERDHLRLFKEVRPQNPREITGIAARDLGEELALVLATGELDCTVLSAAKHAVEVNRHRIA